MPVPGVGPGAYHVTIEISELWLYIKDRYHFLGIISFSFCVHSREETSEANSEPRKNRFRVQNLIMKHASNFNQVLLGTLGFLTGTNRTTINFRDPVCSVFKF